MKKKSSAFKLKKYIFWFANFFHPLNLPLYAFGDEEKVFCIQTQKIYIKDDFGVEAFFTRLTYLCTLSGMKKKSSASKLKKYIFWFASFFHPLNVPLYAFGDEEKVFGIKLS
ncbi:MAG: hypothetical protein IKC01_01930 [Clostridia bacterium]|nr:hypothetical protein [Clostridia bacterium]